MPEYRVIGVIEAGRRRIYVDSRTIATDEEVAEGTVLSNEAGRYGRAAWLTPPVVKILPERSDDDSKN